MARRSQLLQVPKDKARAQIALGGGAPAHVQVFIAPGHGVQELLELREAFIPINFETTTRLVARSAIVWISVVWVQSAIQDDLPGERQQVVVYLRDGSTVSGEARWVAPPSSRRTLDYLNSDARYILLYGDQAVTFVSKDHVVSVEETSC
jgi:hypothetical protein